MIRRCAMLMWCIKELSDYRETTAPVLLVCGEYVVSYYCVTRVSSARQNL